MPLSRIVAIFILVVALLSLSGIASTVEAVVHAEDGIACCDQDAGNRKPASTPCSVPECSCASCIAIELPTTAMITSNASTVVTFHSADKTLLPSEYVTSIDYPPELA